MDARHGTAQKKNIERKNLELSLSKFYFFIFCLFSQRRWAAKRAQLPLCAATCRLSK
jgi:hypothetical protein